VAHGARGIEDERWLEALAQTAGAWKRAYALEPVTAGEAAISMLSRGVAEELAALDTQMHCRVCDQVVDQARTRRERIHCSTRCLNVAAGHRELLDAAA
jgi:hypothetical protein